MPGDRRTLIGLLFGRGPVSWRAYLWTGITLAGLKYAVEAAVVYACSGAFFTA